MMQFRKNACHGYMMVIEPINICWSYLLSREWCCSIEDVLFALVLFAVLVPITPFVYLCVAPFVAFVEGMREEEE